MSLLTVIQKFAVNVKGIFFKIKVTTKSYSRPPGIGFTFEAFHLPLSQQADGFQLLVDSGSSKYFIDPELICVVESRMLQYTRIEPPMEIRAAGDNVLRVTAQGILLVVVRGTDDVLRRVKLPIVLVRGLKRNRFQVRSQLRKAPKQ